MAAGDRPLRRGDAGNVDLVLAEASVRYLAPVRFDEEIEIVGTVAHLGTTSIVTALRVETEVGRAAEGTERHVFVHYGSSEKTPMPDDVRAALEPYLQPAEGPGAATPDRR